jgi:hypothetical protein
MPHKTWTLAFGLIVAASPALAQPSERDAMAGAPAAGPDARYCLRVAANTGSLVERIRCWTREQWVEQGVDVDKEWAREGVSVRG